MSTLGEIPEPVAQYLSWFKSAYGWHPFDGVKCTHCQELVAPIEIYRCLECKAPFHHACLILHCDSSQQATVRQRLESFEWGESGDRLWEARDAGWGGEVLIAYERGLRHEDQADHQEYSPKVRAERVREHARNREFAERYMAREARG